MSNKGIVDWIGRALTSDGQPSSTRLNSFIVMIVLSVIALMLSCKLVFGLGDATIGNTLDGVCLSLAGLGGVAYIGGRIADRNKQIDEEGDGDVPKRFRRRKY